MSSPFSRLREKVPTGRMRASSHGFTWIECLLTLSIFSILLWFSIPFATSLYQKNQMQVIQDDIKSAIRFAKMRALMDGKNEVLMPLSSSHDWSRGMQLRVDKTTQTLFEWHWPSSSIHVSWHGFLSNHFLYFSADINQSATNGYFLIQSPQQPVIKLIINRLGRVRKN